MLKQYSTILNKYQGIYKNKYTFVFVTCDLIAEAPS